MAYVDKVLDHFANPRNPGPMPAADGVGVLGDAACGDVFKVWIRVRSGRLVDVAFQVKGCPAAIACGSMMTVLARGMSIEEARKLSDADILEALNELPQPKTHCSNFAARCLQAAIADYLGSIEKNREDEMDSVTGNLVRHFRALCRKHKFLNETVDIVATELTPEQAIGRPDHQDYPIILGRERMIEADFLGSKGQAFTSRPGGFKGKLSEVLEMELSNDYRQAVFVAVVNAVAANVGLAEKARHCRNADMVECAGGLLAWFEKKFPECRKVFLVGLQPRFLETLSGPYEVRVTDMQLELQGKKKSGVLIEKPSAAGECIEWCDVIFATGSTLANGSADQLVESGKPMALYGVTCAGPAELLDIKRFCPLGR
jgi:NifU-like protein involved in Fe-S cluster formation